jgi:hypothetical protein
VLRLLPDRKKGIPANLTGMPVITGAGDKTRTYDLMITNQLLYQLSYTG